MGAVSGEATSTLSPTRHIFFILAVSAVLMSSIDTTIVAVAVPQLTTALDAPLLYVGWTITAYQLVQVIMLPLAGKLSDSFGRKKVFLTCVGVFTFGSLLCGLASSIWLLASALVLGGIGMGISNPASNNATLDLAPDRAAAMTGVRGMFRLTGGVLGVATVVLVLTFFPDRGQGLSTIFLYLSGAVLLAVPLALMVPDTAGERYRSARLPGEGKRGEVASSAPAAARPR